MNGLIKTEPLRVHGDLRGMVFEPVGLDVLPTQQNVHVAISEPGCVRGNHFHQRATEVLVTVGPVLVRLREEGKVRDVQVPAGEAYRFVLPPGVSHAIRNTGAQPSFLVSFSSIPHDPADPDVVADKLIEPGLETS